MEEITQLESVAQFNAERGHRTQHPLVSVIDQSKSNPIAARRYHSELYIAFLKDMESCDLRYGRKHYDYQEGTLVFIGPGQVMGIEEDDEIIRPKGWAMAFHPDLIAGTSLGNKIKRYSFFSYDVNEALHLSERERDVILECFHKIQFELEQAIDKHSKTLIVSNIELFLNYCMRFYDRQFITRDHVVKDVLAGFENLLDEYYQSHKPHELGLPTVAYCADQLHLSANYFGDLVKKETGKTAQEYIHERVIDIAKKQILGTNKSISEIAYDIGFKSPPHFSRLFKQRAGQSPTDYRSLN